MRSNPKGTWSRYFRYRIHQPYSGAGQSFCAAWLQPGLAVIPARTSAKDHEPDVSYTVRCAHDQGLHINENLYNVLLYPKT